MIDDRTCAKPSDVEQGLVEVGDDVFDVFRCRRTGARGPRVMPTRSWTFLGHGSVGHHRRKRNQSLDATETFSERAKA